MVFKEIYGRKINGKMQELDMDNLLKLKVEMLEINLNRVNRIIEALYPESSVQEKYNMKKELAFLVQTITSKLVNKDMTFYYDVLNQTLLTAEDIRMGIKEIDGNKTRIDWGATNPTVLSSGIQKRR